MATLLLDSWMILMFLFLWRFFAIELFFMLSMGPSLLFCFGVWVMGLTTDIESPASYSVLYCICICIVCSGI